MELRKAVGVRGAAHAPLVIGDLRRARAGTRFGATIHYFESVDSTNTVAQGLAADGAAEGTVVLAETQSRGRGRLGRAWVSPPFRNLYLSVILRPPVSAAVAPQIALVAGVAVAETVSACLSTERAALVGIKWPNDVLIADRKVAGILTEMAADQDRLRFVILGIGVNLNSEPGDFPAELREKAVGLCDTAQRPIDRVAFADRLLSRLEARYDLFLRAGFAAIRPLWESRSCLKGRRIQIDDRGKRLEGMVFGIAEDGALLLRDAAGRIVRVIVGDVTVVNGYPPAGSCHNA